MTKFYCFSALLTRKRKKNKHSLKAVPDNKNDINGTLQVEPVNEESRKLTAFNAVVPLGSQESSPASSLKVGGHDCVDRVEASYEGGDEHDENSSMRRNLSESDFPAQLISNEKGRNYDGMEKQIEREDETVGAMDQSGYLSDPGIERTTAFWGSPRLKRSCSNIERRITIQPPVSPAMSLSFNDLKHISGIAHREVNHGIENSPFSALSSCSADKVMLKKRSSSQVLPSRSRKLWWKLFLWSHRNLHNSWVSKPKKLFSITEKGGYSSDTLEPTSTLNMKDCEGQNISTNKNSCWSQNQWVAFSMESSLLDRVNAWVNTLEDQPVSLPEDGECDDELQRLDGVFTTYEIGESSGKNNSKSNKHLVEDILQANNIIHSLNFLSSGAHISGMGLKVIPAIGSFSSLRSVNLSSNSIVHVTPGALPKSLHTLDLSRNKITSIEGLKELTRLRVLNLSYNKISRIGHGLSNSTLIKELYIAGNKISYVEGLHRLLKLTVLDLSFNKITTAKSLGQLVANYNSLLALNLLGNPIQSNIGDDLLRKAVLSLVPQLAFLNKQTIKPQRAREVVADSVARAALGNSAWSSRRRVVRRVSQGPGSIVRAKGGEGSRHGRHSNGGSSRHRSKSRHHHSPSIRG